MKIAIIILVGLLIVAAIAFIVFRKMQLQNEHDSISESSGINPSDRLKGVLGHAHAHDEQPEPAQNINPLATAEAHLANQNYPEAIGALKNVLMTNPRHQGAMLKLLQVYGLTKQYDAFNQLHQKIHEIGDGESIREADFCKSLLDEEIQVERQAQELHRNANKSPAPTIDTLEFDIEPEQPRQATSQKPVVTQEEELLDLDFNTSTQVETANNADILEFGDFSFDEPKAESKPVAQADDSFDFDLTADTKSVTDNALDLDTGFDFNPTPAAPAVETKAQTDDLSFGLDADFGFDEPKAQPTVKNDSLDSSLDLDTGFDFDPTPAPTAQTATQNDDLAFDLGGNFDFEEPKTQTQDQTEDLSFGLDADFGFDEPKAESKPAQALQADDSFDFDLTADTKSIADVIDNSLDLDTGFDFDPAPAAPAVETKAQTDDLSFGLDADFGFNEPKAENKPVARADDSFDFDLTADTKSVTDVIDNSLDLDTGFDFDPTPAVEQTPEPAPTMAFDMPTAKVATDSLVTEAFQTSSDDFADTGMTGNQEIPSEIGFVSTLDNAQITLDLAKQYLEFGEYDSAKHLLNEVAKTGNEAQRQDAINTIKRLG